MSNIVYGHFNVSQLNVKLAISNSVHIRQGSNGNDCIRKTMCENGQRTGDAEPGPMVIELLRTIFTYVNPLF